MTTPLPSPRRMQHESLFCAQIMFEILLHQDLVRAFGSFEKWGLHPEIRMNSSEPLPSQAGRLHGRRTWRDVILRRQLAYDGRGWWTCSDNGTYYQTLLRATSSAGFNVCGLTIGNNHDGISATALGARYLGRQPRLHIAHDCLKSELPCARIRHLDLTLDARGFSSHRHWKGVSSCPCLNSLLSRTQLLRTLRLSFTGGTCYGAYDFLSESLMDLFDRIAKDHTNAKRLPKLGELTLDGVKIDPIAIQWLAYSRSKTIRAIQITNIPGCPIATPAGLTYLKANLKRILVDAGVQDSESRVEVDTEWTRPGIWTTQNGRLILSDCSECFVSS